MKVSLPRVTIPKRNSLVIIVAALVVTAVLAASIVHYQNQKQAEARNDEKTRLAQQDKLNKADQAIKDNAQLQRQVIESNQAKVDVCNYIVKLPKAKAVAVPAECR